ncbi:MAG: hypothetical protein KGO96_10400 [Elusimicrobia bacterium]|nr:hypothetical protein [Elusimicrobiota bacterium]
MKITRKSPHSGITQTRDLPITPEQWRHYQRGELIQRCFPNLSDGDREFILTGYTEEDWDAIFPPEEDEEC